MSVKTLVRRTKVRRSAFDSKFNKYVIIYARKMLDNLEI